MRLLFVVAVVALFGAGAAVASAARSPAEPPPAPSVAVAVPPPRATPDPQALVGPDRSLELDRAFIAALDDRPRSVVRDLHMPLAGATIPTDPLLLPASDRSYRGGVHEGTDLPARFGTPVHAAGAGVVVRIDHDFVDWTLAARDAALAEAVRLGHTPGDTLDRIRGRQVWIDHGHGIVTRYAHLSAVAADLQVGDRVTAGEVIGAVGSSGYPEGGPHLHFEIRVGEDYLGDGLSGDALVAVLERAVSLPLAEPCPAGAQCSFEYDLDSLGGHRPR